MQDPRNDAAGERLARPEDYGIIRVNAEPGTVTVRRNSTSELYRLLPVVAPFIARVRGRR